MTQQILMSTMQQQTLLQAEGLMFLTLRSITGVRKQREHLVRHSGLLRINIKFPVTKSLYVLKMAIFQTMQTSARAKTC